MLGIIGIVALLIILGLSLFITRLATVALKMTGLSQDAAKFQARSAFTGTGFTTSETESVVDHPVRRRVIMFLMILRSAGLLTIVLSLILTFVGTAGEEGLDRVTRLLWILAGVGLLWGLSLSKALELVMEKLMQRVLERWTDVDVRDYARLLNLTGEYGVTRMAVEEDDWVANRPVSDCRLNDEGVNILGIERKDGGYVGVPQGKTEIHPGDTLILYGRSEALSELDERRAGRRGDAAHEKAASDHQVRKARQENEEETYQRKREEETNREQVLSRNDGIDVTRIGDRNHLMADGVELTRDVEAFPARRRFDKHSGKKQ